LRRFNFLHVDNKGRSHADMGSSHTAVYAVLREKPNHCLFNFLRWGFVSPEAAGRYLKTLEGKSLLLPSGEDSSLFLRNAIQTGLALVPTVKAEVQRLLRRGSETAQLLNLPVNRSEAVRSILVRGLPAPDLDFLAALNAATRILRTSSVTATVPLSSLLHALPAPCRTRAHLHADGGGRVRLINEVRAVYELPSLVLRVLRSSSQELRMLAAATLTQGGGGTGGLVGGSRQKCSSRQLLRLLRLPGTVQAAVATGRIPPAEAAELTALEAHQRVYLLSLEDAESKRHGFGAAGSLSSFRRPAPSARHKLASTANTSASVPNGAASSIVGRAASHQYLPPRASTSSLPRPLPKPQPSSSSRW